MVLTYKRVTGKIGNRMPGSVSVHFPGERAGITLAGIIYKLCGEHSHFGQKYRNTGT